MLLILKLMLCSLCFTLLYYVLLCSVMFCYVLLCSAMFCYVLLCSALFCYVLLCSAMFCYVELKLFYFHHLNTYYVWWCWYWYVDISLYQRWRVIVRSCSTEVVSFKVSSFITNQMKPANKQTIRFLLCWWITIVIL